MPFDLADFDVQTDDSRVFMLPQMEIQMPEMTDEFMEEK